MQKSSSKRNLCAVFLIIFSLFAPAGFCTEEIVKDSWKTSPWVTTKPYLNQAGHKLGFGILNMGSGWLSLFYEPGRPGGFFRGLGRGLGYTAIYTLGGTLHAGTFPIPVDIPLPKGGMSFEE